METADGRIENVYKEFRRLVEQPGALTGASLNAILMHPVSQQKLEIACVSLLKGTAHRRDLIADLKQEAFSVAIARFRDGAVPFQDEGPSRFAGWLWRFWRRACRDAWQRLKPAFQHQRLNSSHLCVEPDQSRFPRDVLWQVTLSAINGIVEESLRDVMLDWFEGLNSVQSARRRCLSPGTVSRRRARGVAAVRRSVDSSLTDYIPS